MSEMLRIREGVAIGGVISSSVKSLGNEPDKLGAEDGSDGRAIRYNAGKPDYSLIPLHLLEGEARVWMHGAKKYSRWQWTKGLKWSGVFASAIRHLFAWQRGEDIDPESGESHLDHAICNIRMLQLYRTEHPELDDRRKAGQA